MAEDLWVQVGRTLIAKRDQWALSAADVALLEQAAALSGKMAADDSDLESIQSANHGGIGGVAAKLGTWNIRRKLSMEHTKLESQLNPLLSQLARESPQVNLPEIVSTRDQAVNADAQAQELEQHATLLSTAIASSKDELERRSDAEVEMGFDAPYLAAYLQTYGPAQVQSPLILKKAEQASLSVPATLARQQTRSQWVGGSQGFSFPIGHTGIRYRVGSFHGHPIQQQFLGKLDTGTLVVTDQRIAFIGNVKSTSVLLAKLLHVECYSDAVAVFQEGREKPDFYLVAQPKYAVFMINWALNHSLK